MEIEKQFAALNEGDKSDVMYNTLFSYLRNKLDILCGIHEKTDYEKRLESELQYIFEKGLKPTGSAIKDQKAREFINRAYEHLLKKQQNEKTIRN